MHKQRNLAGLVSLTVILGLTALTFAAGFQKDLTIGKVTVHVRSSPTADTSLVHLRLSGPDTNPAPVTTRIRGTVTQAEVSDDLDGDGAPELYIYVACPEHPQDGATSVPMQNAPAIVIGSELSRPNRRAAVAVVPGAPPAPQAEDICLQELHFALTKGKNGISIQFVEKK